MRRKVCELVGLVALFALPAAVSAQVEIRWSTTVGSQPGRREQGGGLALDGAGGLFVSGTTNGSLEPSPSFSSDAWIARLGSHGELLWVRQILNPPVEAGGAVISDGHGGAYFSGGTNGDLAGPSAGGGDSWIARFDADGNRLWIRQFGSAGSEGGAWLARDADGGVVLAGSTSGDLGGASAGGTDWFVARYDANGMPRSLLQGGTSGDDSVTGIAVDAAGAVTFGGYTAYGSIQVGWITQLDAIGGQAWTKEFGTNTPMVYMPVTGLCSDGLNGSLAIVRNLTPGVNWTVIHLDANGGQVWSEALEGASAATSSPRLASDAAGGALVFGTVQEVGMLYPDAWLARVDHTGAQRWRIVHGGERMDVPVSAVASTAREVYFGGSALDFTNTPGIDPGEVWVLHLDEGCGADLTTGNMPGQPGYGVPDGVISTDDFFFYLERFAAAVVEVADVTTTAVPGSVGYATPNLVVNNDDFFFYLNLYVQGC